MSSTPTIAHFINPYQTSDAAERKAHHLTLASLKLGLSEANGHIEHIAVAYEDESIELPDGFTIAYLPLRSFRDKGYPAARRYPFVRDMFDAAIGASAADYFVYTNMDIIIQPHFYRFVLDHIKKGHDAMIINRRRIPDRHIDDDLEQILKIKGKPHPGFDCFVFHRDLYHKMYFGEIVHATYIGVTIAHNLFCHARRPVLFDDRFLTIHIGMEVLRPRNEAYWYNRKQFFNDIKKRLWPDFVVEKFPYASRPIYVRYLKWALNPSLFTLMMLKLDIRSWLNPK